MVSRSLALALIALTMVSCGNPVGPQPPEAVGTPDPDTGLAAGDAFLQLRPLSGEEESRPTSVNSAGRVVGTSGDMPVVWDDSVPVALQIPSGANARSREFWINDMGAITGSLDVHGSLRAVRWDSGRMVELGTLPGHVDSRATGQSEAGHISGISYSEGWGEPRWRAGNRGFLWHDGHMTSLPPLPEHDVSLAFGVNSAGVVLGVSVNSLDEAPRFVLWQEGEIIWAQESGDPHAWYFSWVGITDSGDAFVTADSEDEIWRWRDGAFSRFPEDGYDPPRWAKAVSPDGLILGVRDGREGVWQSNGFLALDPELAADCSAVSDGEHLVCEGPGSPYPFRARLTDLAP